MTFTTHWHRRVQIRGRGSQVGKWGSHENREQTPRILNLCVLFQSLLTRFPKIFPVLLREHFLLLFCSRGHDAESIQSLKTIVKMRK